MLVCSVLACGDCGRVVRRRGAKTGAASETITTQANTSFRSMLTERSAANGSFTSMQNRVTDISNNANHHVPTHAVVLLAGDGQWKTVAQ